MKKTRNWLCVLLVAVFCLSIPAVAYGKAGSVADEDYLNQDVTLSPYFLIESEEGSTEQFPLKETWVNANINGVIADIYITQVYANEGIIPINANYVFPASTRVAVHGMTLQIGDQKVTAVIKEKEAARDDYEAAKSEGKSASLLEQQRPNVFTMDVANIMPGDTVYIELHYSELINATEGVYEFVYPTVVGPRYGGPLVSEATVSEQWVASPYIKDGETPPGVYEISVFLSTGMPITDLSCKSHDINTVWNDRSTARISLKNPKDYAGNRDFILQYKLTGQDVSCGLMLYPGGPDNTENFFMLMVQPPERVSLDDIPPREYIFVLDVSGSMYGYPLDTAKELIVNMVTGLRETDIFNLILFSGASKKMSPNSLPATSINIKKAVNLINEQQGGGGTELLPALDNAMSIPKSDAFARSVIIITDGYLYEENLVFERIHKNLNNASFFSFGIGSSVNRNLIEGIAKAGLGESFIVTDEEDAAEVAERFKTYVQSPVLTDINVTYNGFDAYDIEPPTIPTLYAERPIVIFGKWRGEPEGSIQITGSTGDKAYAKTIHISDTDPIAANSAIRYLWARSKVERLLDYGYYEENPWIERSNKKKELAMQEEVTAIGLEYSMMTPYTSFIAVIESIRNPNGDSIDVNQPLPLPLFVSNLAIGYTEGSEPGLWITLLLLLLVLLTAGIKSRARKHRISAGKI